MVHIVGVNQETVIGLRRTAAGFEYAMDRNGDGTVPLSLARLPKLKCYFVDESHADLANNARVIQAVIDIVHSGRTDGLPQRWRAKPGVVRHIDDAELRTEGNEKIDWRRLTPGQRAAAARRSSPSRLGTPGLRLRIVTAVSPCTQWPPPRPDLLPIISHIPPPGRVMMSVQRKA